MKRKNNYDIYHVYYVKLKKSLISMIYTKIFQRCKGFKNYLLLYTWRESVNVIVDSWDTPSKTPVPTTDNLEVRLHQQH